MLESIMKPAASLRSEENVGIKTFGFRTRLSGDAGNLYIQIPVVVF